MTTTNFTTGTRIKLGETIYTVRGKKAAGYTLRDGQNTTWMEADFIEYLLNKPGNKVL